MKRSAWVADVMSFAAACVIAAGAWASQAQAAESSTDWSQYRGASREGISSEKGWSSSWKESPKVLWSAELGTGYSAVSVVGGKVFTAGNKDNTDTIFCLDVATGKELWKHSYPCKQDWGGFKGTRATPTVDGAMVYTLSADGELFCLDIATGKPAWSVDLKKDYQAKPPMWGLACSPLILDKMVIVDVGLTIALDKATGKLLWKSEAFEAGYSSPMPFTMNKEQYIACFNATGLCVFKVSDGKQVGSVLRWKTSWNVNAAMPIIMGDKIFISSGYGTGCALVKVSPSGLEQLWKSKTMCNQVNTSVLLDGCLYGFRGDVNKKGSGKLVCIDAATGAAKWEQGGFDTGSVMLADGKLIIQAEGGDLVIADASPAAYKELARANVLSGVCWTMPVLSGGKIFCRNSEGKLVCLDVSGK